MSIINSGVNLLENGAKYRITLKANQMKEIPQLKFLTEQFENPTLKIGINGRGEEGSTFGIKLKSAKPQKNSSKEFIWLDAYGRIDYRDKTPIIQGRTDGLYNSGGKVSAHIHKFQLGKKLDTSKNFTFVNDDVFDLIRVKSDNKNTNLEIDIEKEGLPHLNKLLKGFGLNIDVEKSLTDAALNFDKFSKDLAKKIDKIKPSKTIDKKVKVDAKTAIQSIKMPKEEEIKINPHDFFKEDIPETEVNTLQKINQTVERNKKVYNLKQQIQKDELQIALLENRLAEVQRKFKETTSTQNKISQVSMLNMIKEDLANAKQVKSTHQLQLLELTKSM